MKNITRPSEFRKYYILARTESDFQLIVNALNPGMKMAVRLVVRKMKSLGLDTSRSNYLLRLLTPNKGRNLKNG